MIDHSYDKRTEELDRSYQTPEQIAHESEVRRLRDRIHDLEVEIARREVAHPTHERQPYRLSISWDE